MRSKAVELRLVLEQAKSDFDRADKAVRAAKKDLFFAREALDKAQTEYVEHIKGGDRVTAGE